jgi:dTDP-4-dehydro-6-deoxy-alpha-D-glucopyranose 2,3-dehydratase
MDIKSEIESLRNDLSRCINYKEKSTNLDFLISSLVDYNPDVSTEKVINLLRELNLHQHFEVEQIPISELRGWKREKKTGDIVHESGGFFSIRGISVSSDIGKRKSWCQPIIDQPEIGILGLLAKKTNGILYFLVQMKAEPGNINTYQISPTVQATYSNYTQVHKGRKVLYIEYFLNSSEVTVLIDQHQSEQGGKFYKKRNRNMIVLLKNDLDIELDPSFQWMTLRQIKELLMLDNYVNMDLRSILSIITYHSDSEKEISPVSYEKLNETILNNNIVSESVDSINIRLLHSSICKQPSNKLNGDILSTISCMRRKYSIQRELIPLNNITNWESDDNTIHHSSDDSFSVIGVRINTNDREITSWDQPIIKQDKIGLSGMVTKIIQEKLYFLVQMKIECGLIDIIEYGPTVQSDFYNKSQTVKFSDLFTTPIKSAVYFNVVHSEEGGRFYKYQNKNILIETNEIRKMDNCDFYTWATSFELKKLMSEGLYVNIECRSILSFI